MKSVALKVEGERLTAGETSVLFKIPAGILAVAQLSQHR
jgi:hypothetical protein